jgi:hypothetical protein
VVIVDGADRLTTRRLHQHLRDASARGTKVVLIDGGSSAAWRTPASLAFAGLREKLDPLEPGHPSGALAPTRPQLVRGGGDETVAVAPTGTEAAARLVADWYQARDGPVVAVPTMAALGPDEADYLNQLARAQRTAMGELHGPPLRIGAREFQAGDEVRALKRDPRLGSAPAGALGQVVGVDPQRGELTIRWPTATVTVPKSALAHRSPLTHAYATTPAYLNRAPPGPIFALGNIDLATTLYTVAPAQPRLHAHDQLNGIAVHVKVVPAVSAADASRSLKDLGAEREQLRHDLFTRAPVDALPQLRRLDEEREWIESRRQSPQRDAKLADLDQSRAELQTSHQKRTAWLEQHRDQLARWADLGATMAWREHALGTAAELRPSRAVLASLGPPPDGLDARKRWREAAMAIEAHRDRRQLPDQQLSLSPTHLDDLRVRAACRAAERARDLDLDRAISSPS